MSIYQHDEALPHENHKVADTQKPSFWSSGLLIATSLALGGIAVALWNRQLLGKMRAAETDPDAGLRFAPEQVAFFEYQPPAGEMVSLDTPLPGRRPRNAR